MEKCQLDREVEACADSGGSLLVKRKNKKSKTKGKGKGSSLGDVPHMKKLRTDIENMLTLKHTLPVFGPVLEAFGVDTVKVAATLSGIQDLHNSVTELHNLPDRFNRLFAERGWIMYSQMNVEVARTALGMAEAGDFFRAETTLANYHDGDDLNRLLRSMYGVRAFRPRMRLAQLALIDHNAGRYHASIPVVLALMDGMVSDLHPEHKGTSAEDTELVAWDSIAAHEQGLGLLLDLFRKGRRKTVTEQISVPYRHGILHGRDLGYDNRLVAAKVWAALFAVRDWAVKAEKGELEAPPQQPDKSLLETLADLEALDHTKKLLDEWEPRPSRSSLGGLSTIDPDLFEPGTPESKLLWFLKCWEQKNYGAMAKCLTPKARDNRAPRRMRDLYGGKNLKSYWFESIEDVAPAISTIKVGLVTESSSGVEEESRTFRLLNENKDGRPEVRGQADTEWIILVYG